MKKYLVVIFLFFSSLSFSQSNVYGLYGKLRIDAEKIIRQSAVGKTNGECVIYLKNEIEKIKKKYSKESPEYIYLEAYYLDFLGRTFDPLSLCFTDLNKEYTEGREEIYYLTKKIYGVKSILYADAIGYFVSNFTSLCSIPLDTIVSQELFNLYDRAIKIFFNSSSLDSISLNIYIPLYLGGKAELFYKLGNRDSALKYYNEAINYCIQNRVYNEYFPPLIALYAQILSESKGESDEGLNFIKKYEPLIKEKYPKNPKIYFNYLCRLLDLALISNKLGRGNTNYLLEAEELCKNEFGENSSNYLDFILNKTLEV